MTPFWPAGQLIQAAEQSGCPTLFRWNHRDHRVERASAHWRVHTLWWTPSGVWRDYWQVTTDTGLLCVLYHDLLGDAWYLERIYE